MSAPASASAAAATDAPVNPRDSLGTGKFVTLDTNQRARGISFAPGTPDEVINSILTSKGLDSIPYLFHISTPIGAVQEIIALMITNGDVTPADCMNIGVRHQAHPDSLRAVANQFHSLRKSGYRFATVVSLFVTEPSKPLSESVNTCHSVTFDFKNVHAFPATLKCNTDNIVADSTKYAFWNDDHSAITLFSFVDHVPATEVAAFNTHWNCKPSDVAVTDWFPQMLAKVPSLSVKVLAYLCMAILEGYKPGNPFAYLCMPEMKHTGTDKACMVVADIHVIDLGPIASSPLMRFYVVLTAQELLKADPEKNEGRAKQCALCGVRSAVVRCKHCNAPRACSDKCLAADWTTKHHNECMGVVTAKPASSK